MNLDNLANPRWKRRPGKSGRDSFLFSGELLTQPLRGDSSDRRNRLPRRASSRRVDFTNSASSPLSRPVDPVRDEVVGPAGPTTATRMDKFTEK